MTEAVARPSADSPGRGSAASLQAWWVRRGDAAGALVVAAVLVISLATRLVLLVQPIGGDPGIYSYVAARLLAGDVPYRDVFEQKPPGILWTYAAFFFLLGERMVSVQILDLAAWIGTLAGIALVARAAWRDRVVAAIAVVLGAVFINPTLQSGFKQVGQTETWLSVWTLFAAWLLLGANGARATSRPHLRTALAGVCLGAAVVYKLNAAVYVLAAAAVVLLGLDAATSPAFPDRHALPPSRDGARRTGAAAWLVAGVLLPPALVCVYLAGHDALRPAYEALIVYNRDYTAGITAQPVAFLARSAQVTWRFATMNVLWMAGGAGSACVLWRARSSEPRALVPVVFFGASCMAALVNAKFYPQYFLQVLPWAALLSAVALAAAMRALVERSRFAPIAAAFLLVLLSPLVRHTAWLRLWHAVSGAAEYATGAIGRDAYYARFGSYEDGGGFSLLADVRLADWIRARTRPDDSIYVYGGEPLIPFLARRRLASRFPWNDPFETGAFRGRFTHADLVRELNADPPAAFLVLAHDANLIDPVDSLTRFEASPILRGWVRSRYDACETIESTLVCSRRRPATPAALRPS